MKKTVLLFVIYLLCASIATATDTEPLQPLPKLPDVELIQEESLESVGGQSIQPEKRLVKSSKIYSGRVLECIITEKVASWMHEEKFFKVKTIKDYNFSNNGILPRDTVIRAHIVDVKKRGFFRRSGRFKVIIDSIDLPNNTIAPIQADLLSINEQKVRFNTIKTNYRGYFGSLFVNLWGGYKKTGRFLRRGCRKVTVGSLNPVKKVFIAVYTVAGTGVKFAYYTLKAPILPAFQKGQSATLSEGAIVEIKVARTHL